MKPVAQVRCVPRHSVSLAAASVASALATIALLLALPLPWWLKAAAAAACAIAALGEAYVRWRHAPAQVILGADRRVSFADAAGRTRRGDVLDATYVSGAFTSIVWRPDGSRRSHAYAIAFDLLSSEERRRLRVLLRYGRAPVERASDQAHLASRVLSVDVPP